MGKYLKFIVVLMLLLTVTCHAYDSDDVLNEYIANSPEYFSDIKTSGDIMQKASLGNVVAFITKCISTCVPSCVKLFLSITAVLLLFAVFSNFAVSENKALSNTVCAAVVMTVVMLSLQNLQNSVLQISDALDTMKVFSFSTLPIVIAATVTSGESLTAALFSTTCSMCTTLFEYVASSVLLPFVVIVVLIGVFSSLSDELGISSLVGYIKSFIKYIITCFLGLFTFSLSIQGLVSKSADNLTKKGIKTAVCNLIPIIGGNLSNSIDGLFALASGTKTALSVVGVLVVLVIFLPPILGCVCFGVSVWLTKVIASLLHIAIAEKILGVISDSFFLLSAMCGACVFMTVASYLLLCLSVF